MSDHDYTQSNAQNTNMEDMLNEREIIEFKKCVIRDERMGQVTYNNQLIEQKNKGFDSNIQQNIFEEENMKLSDTANKNVEFLDISNHLMEEKISLEDVINTIQEQNNSNNENEMIKQEDINRVAAASILDDEFEGRHTEDDAQQVIPNAIEDVNSNISIRSKDGNVLNSPASQKMISQFERFVAKETLWKHKQEAPKIEENSDPDTIPCKYEDAGCNVKLKKGSMEETQHNQECKFRPLKCLMAPACDEILRYNMYISHLVQHFLVPIESSEVITTVILTPQDFFSDQAWTPKWFSAYQKEFFAMITRKKTGNWSSWVWMLGSDEEAREFSAEITIYKGGNSINKVFPVHSLRSSQEQIVLQQECLLLTDDTISKLTPIKQTIFTGNVYGFFYLEDIYCYD